METKINGRTPEEIKLGLKHCATEGSSCKDCIFCADCDVDIYAIDRYALSYIQQLERERDAAVEDMTELMRLAQFCRHCKHLTEDGECTFDFAANKGEPWCWQWRGVQEVE